MKKKWIAGSTLIISLIVCGIVIAQPPGPPRGPHGGPGGPSGHHGPPPDEFEPDPEMREFMEHVMMARLSKDLDLDDEQTVLMVRRLVDIRDQNEKARRKRMKLLREIHETASEDRDNPEIGGKLDELIAVDREVMETRFETFEQASEGLDDWQRARLYVFIQEFDNDMRRLVSRARERYMERGGDRERAGRSPRDGDDARPGPPPRQGNDEFRPGRPPHGPGGPRQGGENGRPGPPPRRGDKPPPPGQ